MFMIARFRNQNLIDSTKCHPAVKPPMAAVWGLDPGFQNEVFLKIYIDYPRPKLIERIASRSDQMLKDGAINEVKRFLKLKIKKDNSSNKIIGIAEIKEYLEKKLDLKDVIEKITIKTRQYAKRQSTWARGQMSNWNKISSKDLKKFLKKI